MLVHTLLTILALPIAYAQEADPPADVRSSAVKVHATRRLLPWSRPWTKGKPRETSGSGTVLEGGLILTNAHVIFGASQIYIQGHKSADRTPAEIIGYSISVDLALLRVEDQSFIEEHPALPMEFELPNVGDAVTVYGYPVGGDDLSLTEGIVSRIAVMQMSVSSDPMLTVQVDAAINPGNSGGPVVIDGTLVGVAAARLREAENIGYMIPADEIALFLDDMEDGRYDGSPRLPIRLQSTENDALRGMLGLEDGMTGSTITSVESVPGVDAVPLQPLDVITHVAGHAVDNEGRVRVRDDLRLSLAYLVPRHTVNDTIELTIYRDGQELIVNAPITRGHNRVMPFVNDSDLRYFIYGPVVFEQAMANFFTDERMLKGLLPDRNPLAHRQLDLAAFPGEELVFIPAPLFPHPSMKGYDPSRMGQVAEVNGVAVRNLAHLVEMLRDLEDEYVVFSFADSGTETLVFRTADMAAITEDVLNDNGIRNQGSPDIMAIWESE